MGRRKKTKVADDIEKILSDNLRLFKNIQDKDKEEQEKRELLYNDLDMVDSLPVSKVRMEQIVTGLKIGHLIGDNSLHDQFAFIISLHRINSPNIHEMLKSIIETKQWMVINNGGKLVEWKSVKKYDFKFRFDDIIIRNEDIIPIEQNNVLLRATKKRYAGIGFFTDTDSVMM